MSEKRIQLLKTYLNLLPHDLLKDPGPDSAFNGFAAHLFSLDPDMVKDEGEECAVNKAIEGALWGIPRHQDGAFDIMERGPAVENIASVLDYWTTKYPASIILDNWVNKALRSAERVFERYQLPLPDLSSVQIRSTPSGSTNAIGDPNLQNTSASQKDKSAASKKSTVSKKQDSKIFNDIHDDRYVDQPEKEDNRKGGAKTHPILVAGTRMAIEVQSQKLKARCIASARCGQTWAIRDKSRILKHLATCSHLSLYADASGKRVGAGIVEGAIAALAQKDPSFLESVAATVGLTISSATKHPRGESGANLNTPPPLKRSKSLFDVSTISHDTPSASLTSEKDQLKLKPREIQIAAVGGKAVASVSSVSAAEGKRQSQAEGDHALVEFITYCGLSTRLASNFAFRAYSDKISRGRYLVPSATKVRDVLIPRHSATICTIICEHLKQCWDLTISFDGGKLIREKFVSVHITKPGPPRVSYTMELDNVAKISQTGNYFYELQMKWIDQIGRHRFICTTSDDSAPTNKGRRLVVEEVPRMFNLADAVHNISNAVKDICNIEVFQPVIQKLRALLAFMSLSTYTLDHFNDARKTLGISRGLQAIGETRFATIYWSLDSVLRGIPAFKQIVRDPHLEIDNKLLQSLFEDDEDTVAFEIGLKRLGAVLMPFARAIQCLEAKETNLADVYIYWIAIVAQLRDLIQSRANNSKSGSKYADLTKDLIRRIANYRFSMLVNKESAQNIYLSAFILHPDHRSAARATTSLNPLELQSTRIAVTSNGPKVVDQDSIEKQVGISLLKVLRIEYEGIYQREGQSVKEAEKAMGKINPRLVGISPMDAIPALQSQFKAYIRKDYPFDKVLHRDEPPLTWWHNLERNEDARVLAALAIKIFSAVPVSMVEERAMSTVKWMNTARRNRQDISTVSDQLIVRNFVQTLDNGRPKPPKPTTVNWRDIHKTIHHLSKPITTSKTTSSTSMGKEAEEGSGSESTEDSVASDNLDDEHLNPSNPDSTSSKHDPLGWLDGGLPSDLSSDTQPHFLLEEIFDIERYLDILADGPLSILTRMADEDIAHPEKPSRKSNAAALMPDDDAWTTWK